MKAKTGFRIRQICGENILVAEGISNIDFTNIISMNESCAYLWEQISGKEFTPELLVELLQKEYNVADEQAKGDVQNLIAEWDKAGLLEK